MASYTLLGGSRGRLQKLQFNHQIYPNKRHKAGRAKSLTSVQTRTLELLLDAALLSFVVAFGGRVRVFFDFFLKIRLLDGLGNSLSSPLAPLHCWKNMMKE
jgi:hypothetical protein